MRLSLNEFGQTFIESVVALPIAIVGVSAFFALIWSLFVSLIAHHSLYEMLICNELFPQPPDCQESTKGTINKVLLVGRLEQLEYNRDSNQSMVVAKITLPFHLQLKLKESLSLPLEPE